MEDVTVPALSIIQLLIPVVMPMIIGFLRTRLDALQGSTALWVNLALNIVGQVVAGIDGGIGTAIALGTAGGLAGSGGASAVNSMTKKIKTGGD